MTAEDFNLPKQTHDIFAIMARGHFISSNGSRDNMGRLYDIINNPDNFDRLQAYFNVIRYNIERGNNYFYFSNWYCMYIMRSDIYCNFEYICPCLYPSKILFRGGRNHEPIKINGW